MIYFSSVQRIDRIQRKKKKKKIQDCSMLVLLAFASIFAVLVWTSVLLYKDYALRRWRAQKQAELSGQVRRREMERERRLHRSVELLSSRVDNALRSLDIEIDENKVGECERLFRPIKVETQCAFALKSSVVFACDYDESESLESNVLMSLPLLNDMIARGRAAERQKDRPDGMVFYCPRGGDTVEELGATVSRILHVLDAFDPAEAHPMRRVEELRRRGWRYEWAGQHIFVTSFGACYDESHPRYAFGAGDTHSFVFLQPEWTFRKVGGHNSATRQVIRKAFEEHNRAYWLDEGMPRFYPFVWNFVSALDVLDDHVLRQGPPPWWNDGVPEPTKRFVERLRQADALF
jgi:hypothetical protein